MDPARAWSRDQRDPSENHPTGLPGGRIFLPPYNHLYLLPQPPSLPLHSHHHGFTLFSHLHLSLPNQLAPPYLYVSSPHSSSLPLCIFSPQLLPTSPCLFSSPGLPRSPNFSSDYGSRRYLLQSLLPYGRFLTIGTRTALFHHIALQLEEPEPPLSALAPIS